VELFLDPSDGRPRTVQIYEQLRKAIVEGRLSPHDRLAPTRMVAADLGVSRSTVTEAYGRLSAEGYIEGRARGRQRRESRPAGPGPPPPITRHPYRDAESCSHQAVRSAGPPGPF
jgi:GntR family transcriptional regulator/MocR family aminotransferase